MSRQHYLPASYVGRFSLNSEGSLRDRAIWVQRVQRVPYKASAEYVGHARRLYDRESADAGARSVDRSWAYEARLPQAIDALSDPATPLDGGIWMQVLVPFISSLFIRGLDFKQRYASRLPGITGPADDGSASVPLDSWHDNTLTSALIEWQRLLAPIIAAQWIVLHGSGAPILPTNDVAHCLTSPPGEPDRIAYAFPLDPSTMLVLERRPVRRVLDWDGTCWTAPVEHKLMPDTDLMNARLPIQHGALREVYGPTLESVAFAAPAFKPEVGPAGPGFLLPSPRMRALIPYLKDYFRLLTLLDGDAARASEGPIDWTVVANVWKAPVQVGANMPAFPGGLAVVGRSVYLDLTRFSIEDVVRSVGKRQLDHVSLELSPNLRALLQEESIGCPR